jgi:hypothetical protein
MVNITNITKVSSVTNVNAPAKPAAVGGQWESQLQSFAAPQPTNVQTMQVKLDREPANITNQNATLSPKQMADLLSRELTRRSAQSNAVRGKSRTGFAGDISKILDENKDLSSLLDGADEGTIAEFLALFQSAMEKHLSGMEFGNVMYDYEEIDRMMAKY